MEKYVTNVMGLLRRKPTPVICSSKKEEDENVSPLDLLNSIRIQLGYKNKKITSFQCELVYIGNYTCKTHNLFVHFAPRGIMFTAVSIVNGVTVYNAIPLGNIQKIYQNLKGNPYFIVDVNRAGTYYIKETLEFDSDRARRKRYLYEPTKGIYTQRFLTFTLTEKNIEGRVSQMKTQYENKIVDVTEKFKSQTFYTQVTGQGSEVAIFDSESEISTSPEIDDEPCYLFSTKKDSNLNKESPKNSPLVCEIEDEEITVIPASSSTSPSRSPASSGSHSATSVSLSPVLRWQRGKCSSQSPTKAEKSTSTSFFAAFPKERVIPIVVERPLICSSPPDDELPDEVDVVVVPPSPSMSSSPQPSAKLSSSSSSSIVNDVEASPSTIWLTPTEKSKDSSAEEPSATPCAVKQNGSIDIIDVDDLDGVEIENRLQDQILFVYPRDDQENNNKVAIRVSDIECLDLHNWLNDNMIDFWCRYFYLEKLNENDRNRSHVFSSFLYQSLLRAVKGYPFGTKDIEGPWASYTDSVSGWVKNLDVFSKDFLFLPISDSSHWVLVAICYPGLVSTPETSRKRKKAGREKSGKRTRLVESGESSNSEDSDCDEEQEGKRPCILIMDSMSDEEFRKRLFEIIRVLLTVEWNSKHSTKIQFSEKEFPGYFLRVPQQPNFSDCGMYILKFFEMFFRQPIRSYKLPLPDKNDWFTKEEAGKFRYSMYSQIVFYMNKHCPENIHLMPRPVDTPERQTK